jgi:formate hydrogenlyase subunit 6/NADH:ubiquinone oxidoreductase subunit I
MKLGAMFGDMFRSLFKRPVTEMYPFQKTAAPARLRGELHYSPEKCTGCQLCVKDCPSNAIELITVDKATKRFVMRYHIDRCTFCAQCVQNCRFSCLGMSNEQWELAALKKEAFTVTYGREEDVEKLLQAAKAQ